MELKALILVTVLALLAGTGHAAQQIPESWGVCKRSGPKFDECLGGAIVRAMKEMKSGNSKFGVLPLDPFKIEKLHLDKGNGGALSIDMLFSDVELVGLKEVRVDSVQSDMSKYKITITLRTPKLDMLSKYKVVGRVLLIPINGNGRTIINMDNPLLRINMQGQMKKGKTGKDHLHVDAVKFELLPEKATFKFINPAHAAQAELLSRVVSENDQVIMQDLQPAISEAFSQAIVHIANRIFDKVSFEDAFPQ